MNFPVERIRKDFPALSETVHGRPLVYLDNAATAQMPRPVMDAVMHIELRRGNVHRGIHSLSEACTAAYEEARKTCADFLGAEPTQITFTSGTTDGINRVASVYGRTEKRGVMVTELEHHSNFVPWQQLCLNSHRPFHVLTLTDTACPDKINSLISNDDSIGLLAITSCSNVIGTVTPVREICQIAHRKGIKVLVDGAQAVCHMDIDIKALDCDFFVCSGHKLGGPFGIGLLYCKEPMEPSLFGGGMVDTVTHQTTTFAKPPFSGEAGTPHVSGAVGLAEAVRYRSALPEGWQAYEQALLSYAQTRLQEIPGIRLLGSGPRTGCLSFAADGCAAFDIAVLLDQLGIAVRSGHHCAQPLLHALGQEYAVRVSPAFYNTKGEIDALAEGLLRILPILRGRA